MAETAVAKPRGPAGLLGLMLVAGLSIAAFRAWVWPDQVRHRQLVVTAPEGASVSIKGGPNPSDVTRGVHAWMVQPGPLTLLVTQGDQSPAEAPLVIPKGLGTLMLDLQYDEAGDLQLGYF